MYEKFYRWLEKVLTKIYGPRVIIHNTPSVPKGKFRIGDEYTDR